MQASRVRLLALSEAEAWDCLPVCVPSPASWRLAGTPPLPPISVQERSSAPSLHLRVHRLALAFLPPRPPAHSCRISPAPPAHCS